MGVKDEFKMDAMVSGAPAGGRPQPEPESFRSSDTGEEASQGRGVWSEPLQNFTADHSKFDVLKRSSRAGLR